MKLSWNNTGVVADPGRDALRLGLNVITGAAYGCELGWTDSPPTIIPPGKEGGGVDFATAVEDLTTHLMPFFLTPKWWLRIAPGNTAAGQARAAHTAFGGYMKGMLAAERTRMADGVPSDSLLTAILDAQAPTEKGARRMTDEEVLGNAFIFLFAGHETTANTLHYALLQLAAHPDAQAAVHAEITALRAAAAAEGRTLSYTDFPRARWLMAVMQETLRMYTPTSMVHKWTDVPAPIDVGGTTYTIPPKTRISVNCTGVHMNPRVWGEDADVWRPQRWIVPAGATAVASPMASPLVTRTSAFGDKAPTLMTRNSSLLTPPATPLKFVFNVDAAPAVDLNSRRSSVDSATTTAVDSRAASPVPKLSPAPSPTAVRFPLTPPGSIDLSATTAGPWDLVDVLRPAKGAFLPFSEGSRACSGRKFASVEFVSALCALLGDRQVRLGEGWTPERLLACLRGRKAGALTLQPPEVVPLVFTAR
jgi:cytochrome P450